MVRATMTGTTETVMIQAGTMNGIAFPETIPIHVPVTPSGTTMIQMPMETETSTVMVLAMVTAPATTAIQTT